MGTVYRKKDPLYTFKYKNVLSVKNILIFLFFNTTQWTITKEFYFSTKVLFFNNTHLTFANWKNSSRYFPKAFSSSLFQTLHGHCKHRKCRHSIYLYTNHLFKTPRRLSYLQRYITIFIRLYYNCLASHNC